MKNTKRILALLLIFNVLCTSLLSCSADVDVTFVLGNGEDDVVRSCKVFSMLPDIEVPEREGYTFSGWFIDEECTKPFGIDTLITSAVTLYAGYEIDLYSLINDLSLDVINSTIKIENDYEYHLDGYIYKGTSLGSGVVFLKQGNVCYMLTNYHVVKANQVNYSAVYRLYDVYGNHYNGRYVCGSIDYDLAVLSFISSGDKVSVAEFASSVPQTYDTVIAVGNPSGKINSVTIGRVADICEVSLSDDGGVSNVTFPVIKSTCPTNKGSSGGPLFDGALKIAGITYASGYDEENNPVCTYSVPLDKVLEFLELNDIKLK